MSRGPGPTLRSSLTRESTLIPQIKEGLGAVAGKDVRLIAQAARRMVGDSLDLDEASRKDHPQENRWDYLLSVPRVEKLVGLEPHSAKDSEISVVIAKRRKSLDYLSPHLKTGVHIARWLWVTRGEVGFSRMERARRLLDQNGIDFAGHVVREF